MQRAMPLDRILRGVIAGLAGGILIDLFLLIVLVGLLHATSVSGFYAFVASAALGKQAYLVPAAVPLGIALHVAISVGWGIGYAYLAATTPQVRARPLLSGSVFGIVVMLAMQLVEVAANVYRLPTFASQAVSAVAHVLFFGIPVAYVVRRLE